MRNLVLQYRGLPRPVYILFLSNIVDSAGCFVFPLLTLVLTSKLGLSSATAGFVVGGIAALTAPALLLGGKLADRMGRKPTIVLFVGSSVALYAVCGLLPPSPAMLAFLIVGITLLNASGPARAALVADLTSPAQRQVAYGLLYLGFNIGFAAGPAIGGFLLERHLGVMFVLDAATTLAALLALVVWVPEAGPRRALSAGPANKKPPRRAPFSPWSGRVPVLLILSVLLLGYSFAYSQLSFLLPIQFSRLFGSSGAAKYGLIAGMNGLIVIVFNPVLTLLLRKWPLARTIFLGGLLYAVGFGLCGLATSVPLFIPLCFVFTLGEIANAIGTMPLIMARTPASHRGRMSGFVQLMQGSGSTIGPLAAGSALAVLPIGIAWAAVGGIALAFSLLALVAGKAERKGAMSDDRIPAAR